VNINISIEAPAENMEVRPVAIQTKSRYISLRGLPFEYNRRNDTYAELSIRDALPEMTLSDVRTMMKEDGVMFMGVLSEPGYYPFVEYPEPLAWQQVGFAFSHGGAEHGVVFSAEELSRGR